MDAAERIIPLLLGLAVLLPLASFWLILCFGPKMGKHGEVAGYFAAAAIVGGFALSLISAIFWFSTMPAADGHHAGAARVTEARGALAGAPEAEDEDGLIAEVQHQRSFRDDRATRPRMADTIQNRTTIFCSAQPSFSKWWWIGAIRKTRLPVRLK